MRVLVTGGCGYIGVRLCDIFKDNPAIESVRIVDKGFFPSGVSYISAKYPEMEIVREDIRKIDKSVFDKIDVVCHLAGLSNDPTADFNPEANVEMNTVATAVIGDMAKSCGIKRMTFASSASVYGFSHKVGLDENSPCDPQSHYGQSKLDAEKELLKLADKHFEPVILRQATVSGWSPRMRWDLVVNTMTLYALTKGIISVHAGGEAYRPIIDVDDVALAHSLFLHAPGVGGQVFNVAHRRQPHGNAKPLTEGYVIGCLALWIAHLLTEKGYKVNVIGDWNRAEGRSYDLSCEKMRQALGWEPKRGVAAMVDGLLANKQNFNDAETRNIDWMTALSYGQELTDMFGGVF